MKIRRFAASTLLALWTTAGCAGSHLPPATSHRSLVDLCDVHKTDKCRFHHGYVELYEKFFAPIRREARKILEIGVARGESVRLWADYFPNAHIYGVDIRDSSQHDEDRITTIVADQASRSDLAAAVQGHAADFDLVIDDGGHTMKQQQTSFGVLFPQLRSGSLYVIEDIHTSFPGRYPGYGVEADGGNSTFAMITGWFARKSFKSKYLTRPELDYLNSNVEECLYWNRHNRWQSDLFICRKRRAAKSGAR